MPAVGRQLKKMLLISVSVAAVLTPGVAYAAKGKHGSQSDVTGQSDTGSGKASATAGGQLFHYDYSKNPRKGSAGPLTPIGNWSPPACWYAPKWTPESAAQTRLGGSVDFSPNHDELTAKANREKYLDGKYGNFNVKKQGKGYWWGAYKSDRLNDSAASDCTKSPFWVDAGDQPPADVREAVSPEILAQLAYGEVRIPQGKASMAPADGNQVVNLPTWVWLKNADFHPVSVTARVDVLNIQATTTATPVSMHIDAGTADAQVYPASGDCPIHNGKIGTERTPGDKGDPPCGVEYLRSTARSGPYQFKATITWKISWVGTGHPNPTKLPAGSYGTPQDVTVKEIQSIVR